LVHSCEYDEMADVSKLSSYAEKLLLEVKQRYLNKLQLIGALTRYVSVQKTIQSQHAFLLLKLVTLCLTLCCKQAI